MRRENLFSMLSSFGGQGEDGERLGKNLPGEGEEHCPLLRILTKQPRKEMPVVSVFAKASLACFPSLP